MDLAAASVFFPKRPSPLFIDLNEIPPTPCDTPSPATALPEPAPPPPPPQECSSEEAYALVCRIHGRLPALDLPAAEFPGEAGVGRQLPCGLCGLPEKRRETMVCDGCDRGFHLSCARYWPRGRMASEDWLCDECSVDGVQKKQKPWGLWAVKLLDMNASPPSEGDGEEQRCARSADGYYRVNEIASSGVIAKDSNPKIGYPVNSITPGNCGGMVDTMANSEATLQHGADSTNGCDGLFLGSFVRSRYPVSRGAVSSHSQRDIFLCSLRDFIAQKGGCLGEGWHVEFKQSANESDSYAVYCAPDGRRFESVFDVARYLGVTSNAQFIESEKRGDASGLVQRSLPSRRRKRDFSKFSASENSFKALESIPSNFDEEHSSDTEILEPQFTSVRNFLRVTNNVTEERCVSDSESLPASLPIQFEDFFVSCFGKIDLRTAYHNNSQIWPVGYKSIWHDKITGSIFECEVFDGGDSGPVFRVKRVPCSLSPIPNAETSILCNTATKAGVAVKMDGNVIPDAECDRDDDILMLIYDTSPTDNNLSSLFSGDIGDSPYACSSPVDMLESGVSTSSHDSCYVERCGTCSLVDDIGEFYVEGRSSAAVWKMVSETVIDICHEMFRKLGRVQFSCQHDGRDFPSSYRKDFPYGADNSSSKYVHSYGSLARFSCAFGPKNAPLVYNNNVLESSCKALSEWLGKDRFGLDVEFVQEMLETLPKSRACPRYQFLKDRSDSLSSWTIGSGQLVAVPKNAEKGEEVGIDNLHEGSKCSVLPEFEEPQACLHQLPHGQPLSNKLPWGLVGDVYQIWEFLCRFHDILGLKETVKFDELEEELVDPWPCVRCNLSSEKHNHDSKEGNSHANGSTIGSLSTHESWKGFDRDNTSTFIPVENSVVREASQAKLAARTYGRCTGLTLSKIHTSLLKVLVGELLNKVAVYVNPNFDAKEPKPRRGRKKDLDNSHIKEAKLETLNINEFTWPELARRYVLSVLSMNMCMDSSEAHSRDGAKVFRCLRGDGGILCGSFSGIAAMETDALLLAEAEKQVFDSVKLDNEVLQVDCKDLEAEDGSEPTVDPVGLPEWAQPLEPVRKLPTNVGTRIRRCIYNALEKDPPEWAKEILQHSISKEVYKGNASGPTKKAVLTVLSQATTGSVQKFYKRPKEKCPISVSDAIMKKCRIVLRSAVAADESKVFCNLIASSLLKPNDNEDEGILGLPAIVSRPLDFRTIDLRLAYGSYGGSHEAFLEDAREVWRNIHLSYRDRPDVSQLVGTLSQNFESLYEKEVLYLVQKFADRPFTEQDTETQNELRDILIGTNELPKAPWEEGVCKVCGIDRDDDSVLLCDTCDSEYHTYCLNPPLARIPEGNWYCPSCISVRTNLQGINPNAQVLRSKPRRLFGEETQAYHEVLYQLVATLEEKEYWELSVDKRVILLKFLCDEVLNSVLMREHLDQCIDRSTDFHQKLRALTVEWRNLKVKEEMLAMRTIKDHTRKTVGIEGSLKEDSITAMVATHSKLMEQQPNCSNKMHYSSNSVLNDMPIQLESSLEESGQCDTHTILLLKSANVKHANGNLSGTCSPSSTSFADSVTAADVELATSNVVANCSAKKDNQAPEAVIQNSEHREHLSINSAENNESLLSNADTVTGDCLLPENGGTNFHNHIVTIPSSCGAKISAHNSLAFHQSATLQGNVMNINFSVVDSDNCDLELSSLKKEILQLQESIASLESQFMMTSLRREFLGKDSLDQLYWIIGRPGKRSCLVVDRSILTVQERRLGKETRDREYKNSLDLGSSDPVLKRKASSDLFSCNDTVDYGLHVIASCSSPIVQFESDSELEELVGWLRDSNSRERELKECILLWRRLRFSPENVYVPCESQLTSNKSSIYEERVVPLSLNTKAANVLERKHGPFLEIEINGNLKRRGKKAKISHDDRMYRCECLEPVWPSRQHCISCHQTFSTLVELEGHNDGKCASSNPAADEGKEIDELLKTKGIRWEASQEKEHYEGLETSEPVKNGKWDISLNLVNFRRRCPYDLNEVSKRFITNNSNKELVKEIGLIGSNGAPSLVPGCSLQFFDPTLIFDENKQKNASMNKGYSNQIDAISKDITQNVKVCKNISLVLQNGHADSNEESLLKIEEPVSSHAEVPRTSSPAFKSESCKGSQSYTIPEPSLRPLVGKISQVVKRLKMNLLDMDAALPGEAIRPSKASLIRRCVWRMFVKSAESIYELVQATILFEDMIKTDYLKNGWWYWSSLTAAARAPTISALALRIYALDDSIIYFKDPSENFDPDSQQITTRVGRKRKDMEVGS